MRNGFGFDLRSMEIFVETLEQGSQSAAARRLGLKQSSVSQSLANLEHALGVALFKRHSRPLEPTSAGRLFHDRARRMLEEARATRRVLLTRHVDIIISDDRLENYDGLERHAVLGEPFVLVVPEGFAGPLDNLRWLARQLNFMRYTPQSLIGQAIERHLRLSRLELPARLHLDNTFALLRLVSAGAGWTITTPLCLYQAGLPGLRVKVAPLPTEPLARQLTLVARRDELGGLPARLATDSRRLLERRFYAEITRELPWLADTLRLGV